MLLPNGTSPGAVVNEGAALFSCHYDATQGNVLALVPSTPLRGDSTVVTLSTDHLKRLRSPATAATPTATPTPSGRPRQKNTRISTPSSPRRAAHAVSSALVSLVSAPEPPPVARMSPSAASAVIAGAFAVTPSPAVCGVPLPWPGMFPAPNF